MQVNNFYQQDLAFVHDQGYSNVATHAADFLLCHLQHHDYKYDLVIDLGCGSGQLVKKLADAGFQTIGVDISPDLIRLASAHSPSSTFVVDSIWNFSFQPCSAVTAVGEIFTYLVDQQNTDENLYLLFQEIYDHLEQDGVFLFDYLEQDFLQNKKRVSKLVREEDWNMFIELTEEKEKQILIRDITLFRRLENGLFRRSKEVHQVRLFDTLHLLGVLKEIGFTTTLIKAYNGLKMREKHVGILAKKVKIGVGGVHLPNVKKKLSSPLPRNDIQSPTFHQT